MKRFIIFILLLLSSMLLVADDIKAIALDGREVILHDDGTWNFIELSQSSIIGGWTYLSTETRADFQFSADGTGYMKYWYKPEGTTFEWITEENKIIFTFPDGSKDWHYYRIQTNYNGIIVLVIDLGEVVPREIEFETGGS